MFGNRRNFKIDGSLISDYDNDIDKTNQVNGKPIYYLKDVNNETIDSTSNAGLVGCFNCSNITIRGLSISGTRTGVGLYKTNHSLVEYNNLTDLEEGIYLYSSNSNTIRFNNISNSDYGIRIESADMNSVENNSVSNSDYGIRIDFADNNSVENNSVSNSTSNPIICDEFRNNKFANNTENASEPKWMDTAKFTLGETATISAPHDGGEVSNSPSETVIGANSAPSSSPSKSSGGGDSYGNLLQLNSPSYSQPDDADLKKLFGGIISFKPKIPMVVNETTDVAASIAPNNTQANKTLYDLKETDTGLVIKGLTISRWMSLKLEDPEEEFQIKALSTEKQEILEDVPAKWRWTVRPKEEGKHPLILVATLLNSSNKESIRDVDVHTEQIEVIANKNETPIEPSPIAPIGNAWKDISSLITTVVGLLTGIFGLILLYRKLKKAWSEPLRVDNELSNINSWR
jgi:parallel beta-helix repeat protein